MDLKQFANELLNEDKINKSSVMKATIRAAKTIFGKADKKKCERTVKAAIKHAKDTEDAIQIAINMMRS